MWKVITIRRSYYETEQVLVWARSLADIVEMLPLLNADACTCHDFKLEE